jgi:hypothetical protein
LSVLKREPLSVDQGSGFGFAGAIERANSAAEVTCVDAVFTAVTESSSRASNPQITGIAGVPAAAADASGAKANNAPGCRATPLAHLIDPSSGHQPAGVNRISNSSSSRLVATRSGFGTTFNCSTSTTL